MAILADQALVRQRKRRPALRTDQMGKNRAEPLGKNGRFHRTLSFDRERITTEFDSGAGPLLPDKGAIGHVDPHGTAVGPLCRHDGDSEQVGVRGTRIQPWPRPSEPRWCWRFPGCWCWRRGWRATLRSWTAGHICFWRSRACARAPPGCAIFHALKLERSIRSRPVDKSSTVLTMLLAWLLLGEPITWLKAAAMAGSWRVRF